MYLRGVTTSFHVAPEQLDLAPRISSMRNPRLGIAS